MRGIPDVGGHDAVRTDEDSQKCYTIDNKNTYVR